MPSKERSSHKLTNRGWTWSFMEMCAILLMQSRTSDRACDLLSMRKQAHKGMECLYAECVNTFHPTDQKVRGSNPFARTS